MFDICRTGDDVVIYSGMVSELVKSHASDETVRIADFSEVTKSSEYYLCIGSERSYPFIIDDKDSYASNEDTIYWNSPVYFILAITT